MNKWAALAAQPATKKCSKCGQEKPETDFHKNRSRPSGLQSWCKVCNRAKSKENYWRGKCSD